VTQKVWLLCEGGRPVTQKMQAQKNHQQRGFSIQQFESGTSLRSVAMFPDTDSHQLAQTINGYVSDPSYSYLVT